MNWLNYLSLSVAAVLSGVAVAVLVGPPGTDEPSRESVSERTRPITEPDTVLQDDIQDVPDVAAAEESVEEEVPVETIATDTFGGFEPSAYADWTFDGDDVISQLDDEFFSADP